LTGWPLRCHSRPALWYSPTCSFFFASAETTGSPLAWCAYLLVDVAELRVAVGVVGAFQDPGVALQAEACLAQQVADRVRAHPVALRGQLGGQVTGGLGGPAQRRHRIAAQVRLDQCEQRWA
jgi:hypothetical protein